MDRLESHFSPQGCPYSEHDPVTHMPPQTRAIDTEHTTTHIPIEAAAAAASWQIAIGDVITWQAPSHGEEGRTRYFQG